MLGYAIEDVDRLYDTLHHAEDGLRAMAQAAVADFIHAHELSECSPGAVEKGAADRFDMRKYGLRFDGLHLTTFARVKSYRLIMDYHAGMYGDTLQTTQRDMPMPSP